MLTGRETSTLSPVNVTKQNRKKNKMKNVLVYSLALVIATAPILIIPACSKSSDSSSDLVGNWAISDYFDGPARSEAVLFQISDTVFVGTGLSDTQRFNDFWKYSLDKRFWTRIADFKGGLRDHAGEGIVMDSLVIFVRADDVEDLITVLLLLVVGI